MTSKDSAVITGSSDQTVVKDDHDVPNLDGRQQQYERINKDNKDDRRDGMEEYAAHYNEPPPAYSEMSDQDLVNRASGTGPVESEIPNRRDFREPDGASGSPSLSGPPKPPPAANDALSKPKDINLPETETSAKPLCKKGSSNHETEDPMSPQEQQIDRKDKSSDSSKANKSIPIIPSTNIGVAFLVTLCFNLPLGALAIYFSLMATKAYRDGKKKQGAKKARISIYISLFSIVVTVLIVSAVLFMEAKKSQASRRRYSTKTSIVL